MFNLFKKILHLEKTVLIKEKISYQDFCFLKQVYQGGKLRIITSGNSMWPTIKKGQIIEVEVLSFRQLGIMVKKKKIVAFYSPEEKKIIIHRVIGIKQNQKKLTFSTKGDNEKEDLIPISLDNILGLVKI